MSSSFARPMRRFSIAAVAGVVLVARASPAGADPPTAGTSASTPTTEAAPPLASATGNEVAESGPALESAPAPLLAGEKGWQLGFFGWAELDGMYDTTQSLTDSATNTTLARPHTIAGDNPRFQGTVRDSRVGLKAAAPTFEGMNVSAYMETDFFGQLPPTATQDQFFSTPVPRLRHFYAKLESPIVNVLAGQTYDLYGWGGSGFFVSTPAFLPVMGELFHRNAQLRLSKVLGGKPIGLEVAVAGVRPADRDSAVPDLQAGLKLTVDGWRGASAQGPRKPVAAPMSVAISAVGRRLAVADFSAVPGDLHVVYAGGVSAELFLPIIPAHGKDLSNALSIVGEYSIGTGVTDLYLNLTGGVLFPSLPNPHNALPAPTYTPNIDNGIATFDANGALHTIDWQGVVVGANYSLPFREGKMFWLSGCYSRIYSDNAVTLTPTLGQNFVWNKGEYWDATGWWDITPAFQMALSFQSMTQTFGDGVSATNYRGEASWWVFF